MERRGDGKKSVRWQGCMLAAGSMLLSCMLLVLLPTGYAVYRYRAAQIYAGNVVASGQPFTLPTRQADTYTLTLQPQTSTPGGMTLGITLRDNFGRTLATSTDFYSTGCPSSNAPQESCPAQSREFQFTDTLGGPVHLALQSTQANAQIAARVRDESAGGIFASGSLFLFGAFFGCGTLLWIVSAVLILFFVRRLEQRPASPAQQPNRAKSQEGDKA